MDKDKLISGESYKHIFINSPAAILILDTDAPSYTILDVNAAYLAATNSTREELVGYSVFGAFPANPTDEVSKNIERTIFSFEQAIKTKRQHTMSDYRYDIPIRGTDQFEERYWTTTNNPVLDELGNVQYFIHSPQNVTELFKLREREKAGIEALRTQQKQLYNTFMQAPVGIAILNGPDFVIDLINPPLCELYGRNVEEMMNKPIFDVLVHSRGMGIEELLDKVRLTGLSVKGDGLKIMLMRNGKVEPVFVNFVYEPYRIDGGEITGVIVVSIDVTEQMNAKQQLEEAEERARLAADAVGLGTFDLNLTNGEMITSVIFANIFGFEHPVPRNEYITVIHPEDVELRENAHAAALNTGTLQYEARVIWPDKTIHWLKVEGKVFYNTDSKPVRILGTLLDTTEQKLAKEAQQKLITLVAHSVDLMAVLNLDGTNYYVNKAGRALLGVEGEEDATGFPTAVLSAQHDLELIEREILPTVLHEGNWAGKMVVRNIKTGDLFPVHNTCIRIDDPVTGIPIAVGVVMRDLRSEAAAKQALADSEALLRNITSAAPTGLWMSDASGYITYVNQTWIKWTGRSFEESTGAGWINAIVPDDRVQAGGKYLNDLEKRTLYEVEFRINHSDGTEHWCVATGSPQYNADGLFTGYIGAYTDITEQKHLQRQKDDFIGIASHELKTPVTSIKAYTQVLEKMMVQNGHTKEASIISRMDGQVNRLTSLIADLLDVTKINSGKLQFNNQEFDFNSYVTGLIEDLQLTTQKHKLVEKLSQTGMVFGDKERIGQVIINLITNAIKYSPDADKIIIYSTLKENEIVLCVQDFGIGISGDNLGKVFEQFYRVSGDMQHTFPGLGLGLYIASEIIKRENGRIWVTSKEGKGSTFCFALPAKQNINPIIQL